ncbi:MAG: Holliday junction branch migration protein RuvA [Clostridiales bacterium]|nr:Holliday junction branch migration protein RuvA [Clostridiales bacterium]
MIHCLTGELIILDALSMTAVIDCCGVGYKVAITGNTLTKLNNPAASAKEKVRLYTYMAVREDAVELYGFYTTEELDTFRMLIGVSGVGPKAAVAILSIMTPAALSTAIQAEDAKALSRAQGVGGKTAARIVLELKDKFAKKLFADIPETAGAAPAAASGGHLSDARDALLVLGYSRSEITAALQGQDPTSDTEEIIRKALAKLMK